MHSLAPDFPLRAILCAWADYSSVLRRCKKMGRDRLGPSRTWGKWDWESRLPAVTRCRGIALTDRFRTRTVTRPILQCNFFCYCCPDETHRRQPQASDE